MVVVTATYTYEIDITLEEWNALSEDSKYMHLTTIMSPDHCDIQGEEV